MIFRWVVILPVVLALCLSLNYQIQHRVDAMRDNRFDEELLYLPNEHLLQHFTGGMSSVIASLLWLRCIQYTTETFGEGRKLEWLNHMCETITRLDPHFVDVYRYGGIFLAALEADDDASIELMRSGMAHNPWNWELPYEIAMVYLLNRRDQPDSPRHGARFLGMAVATGKAPEYVATFAQNIQFQHDLPEIERAMWTDTFETTQDDFMRELAKRKLAELDIRETCAALTEVVELFQAQTGRLPGGFGELAAAGLIEAPPSDPLGGRYLITPDGEVQNTVLLDDAVERRLNRLRGGVRRFHEAHGRYPADFDEMVEERSIAFIPDHPYYDQDWSYDPESGEVSP